MLKRFRRFTSMGSLVSFASSFIVTSSAPNNGINNDDNVFGILNGKYASLKPILIKRYGELPQPNKWIYSDDDFSRTDESDDSIFYDEPRFVHHIDEYARKSLTDFYDIIMKYKLDRYGNIDVLDIASSWVTHYPDSVIKNDNVNIKGIGMNVAELEQNPAFKSGNDYVVQDLNKNVKIDKSFADDESFDIITCAVSIDYFVTTKGMFKFVCNVQWF